MNQLEFLELPGTLIPKVPEKSCVQSVIDSGFASH